jgi:uncharacterized protein (TIGR00661 family)
MARFVFIVQGEGRGHLSQAMAMEEYLLEDGHRVEAVFTSCNSRHPLPAYYKEAIGEKLTCFASPFFLRTPNRKGIYVGLTLLYNLLFIPRYLRSVRQIRHGIRKLKPDLVLNFYDVVGALALRKLPPGIARIGVGHHFYLHYKGYPCGRANPLHAFLLRWHTRVVLRACDRVLALSFRQEEGDALFRITPPLIRASFRKSEYRPGERVLLYLLKEGFITDIIQMAREDPAFRADVFSELPTDTPMPEGITLHGFSQESFRDHMSRCRFLVTTAGFETLAEAAYMGIPLAVIPAGNHFEQQCNALDLERSGLGIALNRIDSTLLKEIPTVDPDAFRNWVNACGELIRNELKEYYPTEKRV